MLSTPKHYDYQDAADKLGISVAQLGYHIKKYEVRVAVATANYGIKALMHPEDLSQRNQLVLMRPADQYFLIKEWEPVTFADEGLAVPEYLYVSPFRAVIRHSDESSNEFKCFVFEMFDGQPIVCVGEGGYPEHIYLGSRDERGLFSGGVITRAELERIQGEVLRNDVLPNVDGEKLGYFEVDKRGNPVRDAICYYGNLFIEEHKSNPSADVLLNFMLDKAKSEKYRQVSKDETREKPIKIVGTWMSERDFERRMKRLFKMVER